MTRTPVTLFVLPDVADAPDADDCDQIVYTTAETLEVSLVDCLDFGGVVAVVADDDAASRLLKSGADEVVRADAPGDLVRAASARARLRANARWARTADSGSLSALVRRVVDDELMDASMQAQTLRLGIGPVGALADEYARSAVAGVTSGDGRVVALRVGAPSTTALTQAAARLGHALHSVAEAVHGASVLAPATQEPPTCDAVEVALAVSNLARPLVARRAEFSTTFPDHPCPVAISRSYLANVLAEVLQHAVTAVECSDGARGHIELGVTVEDGYAVVTVDDDGGPHRYDDTHDPGLAVQHVERVGGGVLVDQEIGRGTTVRIFLPQPATAARSFRQ